MTDEKPKVVSLFAKREPKKEEPAKNENEFSFEEQMERNRKLKERIEKDRLNANKIVLRMYRIKN